MELGVKKKRLVEIFTKAVTEEICFNFVGGLVDGPITV